MIIAGGRGQLRSADRVLGVKYVLFLDSSIPARPRRKVVQLWDSNVVLLRATQIFVPEQGLNADRPAEQIIAGIRGRLRSADRVLIQKFVLLRFPVWLWGSNVVLRTARQLFVPS